MKICFYNKLMNQFMFIANQGENMLRLFSAIYPSFLKIHYFCCNVIRFLARTKGSKRNTLGLHNVDLRIGAKPHKMCCQKHALSKTYCQKHAVQDKKEAGDHKADCLWHIVQECRHIVFNLAHVSLAKSLTGVLLLTECWHILSSHCQAAG